ncbi:MAG TPA: L,D-transpeptidase family protein [Gemmatimonadales bacterium]|nr:L,D-transpeptidase family protein [Gemmatimonadales bacterium]
MKIDSRSYSSVISLLVSLAALGMPASATAQSGDAVVIRGLIAAARVPGARWPDFPRYLDDVARLYASHNGVPVWFREGRLSSAGQAAIGSLLGAASHGLAPEDYDAAPLDSLAQGSGPSLPPAEVGRLDLMLSVDLIRYLDDLRRGRSKGVVRSGTVARMDPPDWADAIDQGLRGDSIGKLADQAAPALTQYRNLRALLARYRRLARDTVAFAALPAVPPAMPGQPYAALTELKRRLVLVGDLAGAGSGDTLYTGEAVEAVRQFQRRHGLEPDGVIGPATSAALNVPPARRVRQIELALERIRWLPPLGREPFLVVNIPAFYLFGFDSAGGTGAPSFTSRVVVGRALDTETPVLYESLRYVEFRPYWNVPRSIVLNEILPRLRRDPEYLGRYHMEVVGPADRLVDDTASSDLLRRLTGGEIRIRQRPGLSNALGLVKFVFPNAASVYLHDTPDTELFSRSRRDFSHGCIRVEEAEALAVWVLRGQPAWDSAQVHAAVKGPGTRRAFLTRPMPVAILYTTAVATPSGEAWFFEDIYDHDRALEEVLRAGPSPP